MTKQFWTKFVHHEHHARTQLLTRDQRGGYYDIFNACFLQGGYVPDDDRVLAQITTSSPEEWAQLRPVLARLFTISKQGWSHPDLLAEMQSASAKIEARRDAGRKGGKAKAQKDKDNQASKSQPVASDLPCHLQLQSQLESHLEKQSYSDSDSESEALSEEGYARACEPPANDRDDDAPFVAEPPKERPSQKPSNTQYSLAEYQQMEREDRARASRLASINGRNASWAVANHQGSEAIMGGYGKVPY